VLSRRAAFSRRRVIAIAGGVAAVAGSTVRFLEVIYVKE